MYAAIILYVWLLSLLYQRQKIYYFAVWQFLHEFDDVCLFLRDSICLIQVDQLLADRTTLFYVMPWQIYVWLLNLLCQI